MITAIDTNILLNILIPDEAHMTSSKEILDEYLDFITTKRLEIRP